MPSELMANRRPAPSHTARNVGIAIGIVVAWYVAVLAVLFSVPVPQETSFRSYGDASCPATSTPIMDIPKGSTLVFRWTTNPAGDVNVTAVGFQHHDTVYFGTGSTGNGSFRSTGEYYEFNMTQVVCGSPFVAVTITGHYRYTAPFL